ncbi:unnamed protein product, partial [Rotaria sordida]
HFDINNPLSSAFKLVEKQIGSLPVTQLIVSALPQALEEEYAKRKKDINQLIHTTIDLVNSSGHLTTADAARAVTEIFRATNPSSVYEANRHKLNSSIRSIVEQCVKQYIQFQDQIKFLENQSVVQNCIDMLRQQNISYETLMKSNGSNLMQTIIRQQLQSNNKPADILKTVL